MEVKESTITLLNKRMAEMDAEIKELEIKRDELAAKNRLQAQTLDKVVAERDNWKYALKATADTLVELCQGRVELEAERDGLWEAMVRKDLLWATTVREALHKDNTIDHTQDWEGWGKGPNLSYEQVAEMVKQEKPITPQEADNG